jgi:hypothetical protein
VGTGCVWGADAIAEQSWRARGIPGSGDRIERPEREVECGLVGWSVDHLSTEIALRPRFEQLGQADHGGGEQGGTA